MIDPLGLINTEVLLNSTPTEIYHYMKEKYDINKKFNVTPDVLEKTLYEKDICITNLALAQFALDREIIRSLFNKKCPNIRIAAILN